MRRLSNIGRLFTGTPTGVIEGAAVICDGEEIAWCGKSGDEPRDLMESVTDENDFTPSTPAIGRRRSRCVPRARPTPR